MGQCATRLTETSLKTKKKWEGEVLSAEPNPLDASFAPLAIWKEKFEPPNKRSMPGFIRRRLRAKVHDMAHWNIVCMVLEVISNVFAQLELQLMLAEEQATAPPPVLTSKVVNALNGAVLSYRFRYYEPKKFDYLRGVAVSQIAWQLALCYREVGVAEARSVMEQAMLPVLKNRVERLEEVVRQSSAVQQLEASSPMGGTVVSLITAQLRSKSQVMVSVLQAQLAAVLDMGAALGEEMQLGPDDEMPPPEELAELIEDRLAESIEFSYQTLDDGVTQQLHELADTIDSFMQGGAAAASEEITDGSLGMGDVVSSSEAAAPEEEEGEFEAAAIEPEEDGLADQFSQASATPRKASPAQPGTPAQGSKFGDAMRKFSASAQKKMQGMRDCVSPEMMEGIRAEMSSPEAIAATAEIRRSLLEQVAQLQQQLEQLDAKQLAVDVVEQGAKAAGLSPEQTEQAKAMVEQGAEAVGIQQAEDSAKEAANEAAELAKQTVEQGAAVVGLDSPTEHGGEQGAAEPEAAAETEAGEEVVEVVAAKPDDLDYDI